MSKQRIDEQAIKRAVSRAVLRLLPAGALFLPLGAMSIKFITEKTTRYNIVELIKSLGGQGNELLLKLLEAEQMAAVRSWIYVTAVGLVLSVLAILAGFAFLFAEKVKPLAAGAAVYGAGVLGIATALTGFIKFGAALGGAMMNIASAAVEYGAWVLAAALLLNLAVCLTQWHDAREQIRLTELARQQKKKKNR